jgi:hypothetical protein
VSAREHNVLQGSLLIFRERCNLEQDQQKYLLGTVVLLMNTQILQTRIIPTVLIF